MLKTYGLIAAALGTMLICDAASAQVTAELISAGKDGAKTEVGVLLKIAPGNHVYWKNPGGDNGFPTSVKWDLPEGAKAGELQWPVPVKFNNADKSIGLGYDGDVLLKASIDLSGVNPDTTATIGASVRWLACTDSTCTPGRAKLTLVATADKAVFDKFAAQYPAATAPEGVTTTPADGKLTVSAVGLTEATFFPDEGPALPTVKAADGKAVFETTATTGVMSVLINGEKKVFGVR